MPAEDTFYYQQSGLTAPIRSASPVTPSDTLDFAIVTRSIYVGVAGDVKVTMAGGQIVTYKNLPVGQQPIRITKIHASGTTAAHILAEW